MTVRRLRTLALACLALALSAAQAQYTNSMTGQRFGNMWSANADYMTSRMIQQNQMRSLQQSVQAQVRGQPAPPAARAAAFRLPLTMTDFKPAGPRNAPEQLAAGAANAKDRQQLIDAGRGIHRSIEVVPGFRKNNLASAMTVILGVSLQVAYGIEVDDARSQAIMRQLNDSLGEMPEYKALTAQQRTQMYDAFIVIGGFIAGIARQGAESGNAELADQARAMALDSLARFGIKA